MKLSKDRVTHLSKSLVSRLQGSGHLKIIGGEPRPVIEALERAITTELSVEDRLNAEVRDLMKQYGTQIEQGGVDYQKMFTMIKNKLVRERGLIL